MNDNDEDGDYDMKEEEDNIILEEGTNYDELPNFDVMNNLETFDINKNTDDEEYNPFIDMPKEINNLNDFNFIYFNYKDYNGKEENIFKGKITIKYLYKYCLYLKKKFRNNEIVLNMGSEIPNNVLEVKDLLSITDIVIFYEKNKLYQILNNFHKKQKKIKREHQYFKHFYDNKIKKKTIKQYLDEEDKREYFLGYFQRRDSEKNNPTLLNNDDFFLLFKHNRYDRNLYSIKLSNWKIKNNNKKEDKKDKIVKIKNNKYLVPLTKVEMFNYYKSEIIEKDLSMKQKEEKLLIVLDELSKLYIVQFNKSYEKPFIFNLDIKLYDKINVHNIDRIKSYKEEIKSHLEKYSLLYISYLLSSLISFTSKENNISREAALFIGYYGGQKILKKIVNNDVEEDDLIEDNFYLPNLTKKEIDDLIEQVEKRKNEIKFILDGNNKNIAKLKLYNSLLDKNAISYLNNEKNKNYFKIKGFIDEEGKLLYDPVYKESLIVNKNEIKLENEKDLIDTCRDVKTRNNFKMKENECLDNYKNKNEKLDKFMAGIKQRKYEYGIYLKRSRNQRLPFIKKSATSIDYRIKSPFKQRTLVNLKINFTKKQFKSNIKKICNCSYI